MSGAVTLSNGTWTDESLPESRRKELLQEDLRRLRVRRSAGDEASEAQAAVPAAGAEAVPAARRPTRHADAR